MSVTFDQAVLEGLDASKPAASAGTVGRLYFATDTGILYRDNGSAWVERANDLQLGTTGTTAAAGNDSRLSDARTPTAHATSHESGGSDAFTGIVPGSAFAPAGLTGATAASRYVGATASGAPASGTFALGDFVIDQSGTLWVCTTAGSPGTWTQIAGGGGGGGAPTTAPYVTTASDATLTAEVVLPGLAASVDQPGVNGPQILAGTTIAEHYETTATGLTWGTAPAVVDSNTTIKSHLYVVNNTSGEKVGTRSYAPAGAFDARCKITVGSDTLGVNGASYSFQVADSGGTNRIMLMMLPDTTSGGHIGLQGWNVTSNSFAGAGSGISMIGLNQIYLRITRDATTNFTFWYSANGLLWMPLATTSKSLTIANIGWRCDTPASTTAYMAVDWLRAS